MEVNIPSMVAKARITRTVYISQATIKVIRKLLECRPQDWDNKVPVFCNQDGGKLNETSWGRRIRKYGDEIGIHLTPYMFRHSSAIMFLRNGGNTLALQRTLGHTDLTMTKRYVALTQQDLREQHTLASPLNKLLPQRQRVRKIK
jgi:site-specific recombinase XerD